MVINYRKSQTERIASKLNLAKIDVDTILKLYYSYLIGDLFKGKTVKVLNICYLHNQSEGKVTTNRVESRETLAYIAKEISDFSGFGTETIKGVLNSLEDDIVEGICQGEAFAIKGLVRIRCIVDESGQRRVRIKKSTNYNGLPISVVTLNSFRRKVGSYNAG